MIPSLGVPELVVLLVIILIIFGVGRLPEIGGALGKSIREFRRASTGEDVAGEARTEKKPEDKS